MMLKKKREKRISIALSALYELLGNEMIVNLAVEGGGGG
jgi:hypothetical protein